MHKEMFKDLIKAAQQCPQAIQEHNRRTGALIRQLLEINGRGDLVAFWRLEEH